MHKLKQVWKNIKIKFSLYKTKITDWVLKGYCK